MKRTWKTNQPSVFGNNFRRKKEPPDIWSQKYLNMLLAFTQKACEDKPEKIIPYARNYFDNLTEEPSLVEEQSSSKTSTSLQSTDYMVFSTASLVMRRERQKAIFSEAYNPELDDDDDQELPYHHKNHLLKERLLKVVKNCVLFKRLDKDEMLQVIDAMFQKKVKINEYVIRQGEEGDHFYIIERGNFDAYMDGQIVTKYEGGGYFGELALLYNMPRAASVKSTCEGILWGMDRRTFRKIVLKSLYKRRKMYEDFLLKVPILEELTNYERGSLADCLTSRVYTKGHAIIKEGDPADGMFFVEDGIVRASKKVDNEATVHLTTVYKGGYFGELALVNKQPRAATVVALSDVVKVAFLEVEAFERILGPCMDIMKRAARTYDQQLKNRAQSGKIDI